MTENSLLNFVVLDIYNCLEYQSFIYLFIFRVLKERKKFLGIQTLFTYRDAYL